MRRLPSLVRRFRACASGASALEFAIVVTPLLLIAFGSLEFGRLMWTRAALQETAMATARCMGVLQPSCAPAGAYDAAGATTFLRAEAANWSVAISSATVTLSNAATCSGVSGFSKVSISYSFQTVVPGLLGSLSSGIPIQTEACFPNQS